jgi:spore germination protein GerM
VTPRGALAVVAIAGLVALLAWGVSGLLPEWSPAPPPAVQTEPATTPPGAGRKIKARLFYVSEDGSSLTSVEREVPFGDTPSAQAKAIVEAQIAPVTEPFVSPIPAGTTLRALFVTPDGEAYLDLSSELMTAHRGGSLTELLTIYSLVNAVTVNLPAIAAVQVLVDGKEVDTLAGHVDLRQPLVKNLSWVQ